MVDENDVRHDLLPVALWADGRHDEAARVLRDAHKLDSGNESLALSGSDEVPAGFRTAIEEYYRLLAKKQTK